MARKPAWKLLDLCKYNLTVAILTETSKSRTLGHQILTDHWFNARFREETFLYIIIAEGILGSLWMH